MPESYDRALFPASRTEACQNCCRTEFFRFVAAQAH